MLRWYRWAKRWKGEGDHLKQFVTTVPVARAVRNTKVSQVPALTQIIGQFTLNIRLNYWVDFRSFPKKRWISIRTPSIGFNQRGVRNMHKKKLKEIFKKLENHCSFNYGVQLGILTIRGLVGYTKKKHKKVVRSLPEFQQQLYQSLYQSDELLNNANKHSFIFLQFVDWNNKFLGT